MFKSLKLFVASLAVMALLAPWANEARAGATAVQGGTPAIEILSPANQARLAGVPVDIRARFNVAVDIGSFTAALNGKDVTKHFTVTEAGVTGQLSIADGLRPSLGKDGQVSAPNLLKIAARGKANGKPYQANRHFFLLAPSDLPRASAIIGPGGGQVSIPGFGAVTFPAGAFAADQRVELSVTADPDTDDSFVNTAIMFGVQSRLPYEFRINSGTVAPKTDFQVTFEVPLAFRQSVLAGSEVRFFGENYWDGPNETLVTFELFGGRFTAADVTVTTTLPVSLFTTGLTRLISDGTYQAIVTLGTTPTARPTTLAPALTAIATAPYVEQSLPPPLDARSPAPRFLWTPIWGNMPRDERLWARRRAEGVRAGKPRMLRLMREAQRLAPARGLGPRHHDGTIIPADPNERGGSSDGVRGGRSGDRRGARPPRRQLLMFEAQPVSKTKIATSVTLANTLRFI